MASQPNRPTRRGALAGAGLAMGAAAVPAAVLAAPTPAPAARWDAETDVLCVGSGAAACAAAVTAVAAGAQVMVVEKMPVMGGTTAKSGGVAWIPNHHGLRAQGVTDAKADAMAYMCRYSYPQQSNPKSPTLGLNPADYRLIEAFYENGSKTIDFMAEVDAVRFKRFRLFQVDEPAPDYADHLPENKVQMGRSIEPAVGSGSSGGGTSLAAQMEAWLAARNVPLWTDTPVTRLVIENGRAVGVEAEREGKPVRIRARKAVVFGTGGYSYNPELCGMHQTALYGSCAMPGSTGDFIPIAAAAGAMMGPLDTAWRTQVLFEEAQKNRAIGLGAFVLPGDSMVVLPRYGVRVVNEKRCYNDRTRIHFAYDPGREEYPNQLLFMVFDQRSLDRFGGVFPYPAEKGASPYLVSANDLPSLAARLGERLAVLSAVSGGVRLDPGFAANAKAAVGRFNGYAKAGVDPEFERGARRYDVQWHKLFSYPRAGTLEPVNPYPNLTMHPLSESGPFHAFILAAGALDTCGGPRIN